jgi:sodium-dependent dicarboxylate transporter 2/3/5
MVAWKIIAGPLVGVIAGCTATVIGLESPIAWTAGITAWVAIWWITEPIPIPATALIPIAAFPLVGVLDPKDGIARAFGDPLILLMLGGFMLSAGVERSGAHRRIALNMVNLLGADEPKRLVFGFMAASAILSMWISNSATCLMLLPIVLAVVDQTRCVRLQIALLLGVAYAASVGGIGTPIGTPPNLIFIKVYEETTGIEPAFGQWMGWALPIVLLMLPAVGLWLTRGLQKVEPLQLPDVGDWRPEEVRALSIFGVTAILWMSRKQPWGGWSETLNGLGIPHQANDASVAFLGVVAMFLVPNGKGEKLLDWQSAKNIPWGILILFSSGICIASAFSQSGLSALLGEQLAQLGAMPVLLMIGTICLSVTFLTEITSNTATTALLMPILAAAAVGAKMDPRIIMVPAAISASFAFMLPVATGPNAIIFGSQRFRVSDMSREGIVLNFVGVVIVSTVCYLLFGRGGG